MMNIGSKVILKAQYNYKTGELLPADNNAIHTITNVNPHTMKDGHITPKTLVELDHTTWNFVWNMIEVKDA